MKEIKLQLTALSFFDQQAIERRLTDMAQSGWMIEKMGNFFWTYRRAPAKKLHFAVTYFPDASEFDPGPTEGELTKADYCAEDGWKLVLRWGVLQVFCNEQESPVPIETDPGVRVKNIFRAMKKSVLLTHLILSLYLVYFLVFQVSRLVDDPVGYLSDPFYLYSLPLYLALLLAGASELILCLVWYRKARRAAENGVFLPIRSRPVLSFVLIAFSGLCLMLSYTGKSSVNPSILFALGWIGVLLLISAVGIAVRERLKRSGTPRRINRLLSMSSVLLLTLLCSGLFLAAVFSGSVSFRSAKDAVGSYNHYGMERPYYNDALPLEIEDLRGADDTLWNKEADHQQTLLCAHSQYKQQALPLAGNDPGTADDLAYALTQVRLPFLYEPIKKALLNTRQDEVFDDFVFINHYEAVDPSLWLAEEVYQLHWSDSVLETYLVCWEEGFAEITFYWQPSEEEISRAAQMLKSSF